MGAVQQDECKDRIDREEQQRRKAPSGRFWPQQPNNQDGADRFGEIDSPALGDGIRAKTKVVEFYEDKGPACPILMLPTCFTVSRVPDGGGDCPREERRQQP